MLKNSEVLYKMVIEPKNTTVAYRCPHCGGGVLSAVSPFAIGADMIKLKCECGKSEMSIVFGHDGKVKLSVPCMLCPKPHNFTVSKNLFFGKELFLLPCPYSDVNICFMGDMNMVKAELSKTELELLDMLEKSGIEGGFEALHAADEADLLPDPQIYDIIMFVIKDLEEEGRIYCRCSEEKGEYEAEVLDYGIRVRCTKCGAEQIIPTDSLLAANAFLNADSLHLE